MEKFKTAKSYETVLYFYVSIMHGGIMKKILLTVLLLSVINCAVSMSGRVEFRDIAAPSLEGAVYATPVSQEVMVYTPPEYDLHPEKEFPLLIFLPGYATSVKYAHRIMEGWEELDLAITSGEVSEMILIVPNGLSFCLGCFYTDSPLTGKWESYITADVIEFAEKNYRVRKGPENRGICGHSMGGTGALNIAMNHPDIFGAVYALSPGIFDENGLYDCDLFKDREMLNEIRQLMDNVEKMDIPTGEKMFMNEISSMIILKGEMSKAFFFAYAMAYAHDISGKPPYIIFPFKQDDKGQLTPVDDKMRLYESGFGDTAARCAEYRTALESLSIGLDWGSEDSHEWIPRGCEYFVEQLNKQGINIFYETYKGGHIDKLKERFKTAVFPFFSEYFRD